MASIWKQPISIATLTEIHHHTTVAHLGIEFVEVADDYLRARVPVDLRTRQPYGIAGSRSKRNTLCKWGGRVPILATSSSGKKGLQTWRTNSSPETNDMPLLA